MKTGNYKILIFFLLTAGIFFTAGFCAGRRSGETTIQVNSAVLAQQDGEDGTSAGKVNLNTAGVDELRSLDGIGTALAERIVSYRTENGPFGDVEELTNVKGIGEETLKQLRDQITVE